MNYTPDKNIMKICGRSTRIAKDLYLGYSGSYVEFEAVTDHIEVTFLSDEIAEEDNLKPYVAVFVNNEKTEHMRFALTAPEETICIYQSDDILPVTIRITKMSEAAFGLVGIREIKIAGDSTPKPTAEKERKIEFIGDSITCGYGNEGVVNVDVFCTRQENPEDAYAILTANALQADYHLVSWSGIGVISDWVDETVNEPREEILMPDLYQYTDLRLCEKLNLPKEHWNFTIYRPDLVVINLGTNDDSYVRTYDDRRETFGKQYFAFLEQVHKNNPQAAILCVLGIMYQRLVPEEQKQVSLFRAKYPDVKIDHFELPLQKEEDGMGADFHPSKITHQKSAALLTEKIRSFMNWN